MLTVQAVQPAVVSRSDWTSPSTGTITACIRAKLPEAAVSASMTATGPRRAAAICGGWAIPVSSASAAGGRTLFSERIVNH